VPLHGRRHGAPVPAVAGRELNLTGLAASAAGSWWPREYPGHATTGRARARPTRWPSL